MSRLGELIAELCPNGVAILALNDVIYSLNTGLNPRQFFKLNTDDATNYYITIREIRNGHIVPSAKTDRINDEALALCNNRSNLEVGDILFSGTGTIGETAVITEPPQNWNIKEGVYTIKPNQQMILSNFLRYLLTTEKIKQAYMKKVAGGTVKSIPMAELKKIKIPVPPLPVQREIVRILDNFTELTTELIAKLTAEQIARKKQYEYYRDMLLTFDFRVKFYFLSEITHYAKKRIDVSQVNETSYVGVENLLQDKQGKTIASTVPNSGTVIAFEKGNILIGNIRPYLRKIWLADCNGGTNGDVLAIQIEDKTLLTPKFLYYVLSSEDFFLYNIQNSKGAKMPRGSKEAVMNYQIPVPPLPVQQRIVNVLDRFDALCNDLTYGLPAEIEARQKQYEFFRDKLLTFSAAD